MSAFDALEKRLLDLSMAGAQDSAETVVVVGLFTAPPPEDHDGSYGIAGEPAASGVAGTGYRRARCAFGTAAESGGVTQAVNTDPVTLTGLAPGTYTHFGIFGSSSAGQA